MVVVSSQPQLQKHPHVSASCAAVDLQGWLWLSWVMFRIFLLHYSIIWSSSVLLMHLPVHPPPAYSCKLEVVSERGCTDTHTIVLIKLGLIVLMLHLLLFQPTQRLNGVHSSSGGSDKRSFKVLRKAFDEINMQNDEQRRETKRMTYREEKRGGSSELEHTVDVKFLLFVQSLEGPSALL